MDPHARELGVALFATSWRYWSKMQNIAYARRCHATPLHVGAMGNPPLCIIPSSILYLLATCIIHLHYFVHWTGFSSSAIPMGMSSELWLMTNFAIIFCMVRVITEIALNILPSSDCVTLICTDDKQSADLSAGISEYFTVPPTATQAALRVLVMHPPPPWDFWTPI